MKLITYLSLVIFAFACSSDDDNAPQFNLSINAGGPAYTFQGKEWLADEYVNAGSYTNQIEIENTDNDTLFHTESFDSPDFTYEIPIQGTGPFAIDLHFAEIFHGIKNTNGAGARVFNVDIEDGQESLTDFDIIAKAGGPAIAITESFTGIMVEDGSITIKFTSVQGDAKVSGIEISGNL